MVQPKIQNFIRRKRSRTTATPQRFESFILFNKVITKKIHLHICGHTLELLSAFLSLLLCAFWSLELEPSMVPATLIPDSKKYCSHLDEKECEKMYLKATINNKP